MMSPDDPMRTVDEVFARIAASPDPATWIALRDVEDVRREAAALRDRDRQRLPLWGVPFGVKDNIDVAGLDTTAACRPFAYRPVADAPVVARLRAAGALVIGKTNMDQFATGLVGVRSPYGMPRCVFDPAHVSGGSSSGSAVAVARGEVAFALGTDTAGSGRVPAAFNHLVGVKPTRGLLSTRGVVPACRSLDVISVFATSCADADLVRRAAQAGDAGDPYSRAARRRPLPLDGLRVGVLAGADRDFNGDDAAAALYERAIGAVAALGWSAHAIDYAPFRETAALLYDGPWLAERYAALAEALARHGDAVDPTVRRLVEPGARLSAVDAFRGLHRRAALAARAATTWAAVDVLLLPTAPTIPRVDDVLADPIRLNATLGRYTNFVNLLDYCGVAVPAGFRPDRLPLGVTVIAPAFADDDLAVVADRLHRALVPSAGLACTPLDADTPAGSGDGGNLRLAVVGAHLSGLPLNHQLTSRDAVLVARTHTAPTYRLHALPGSVPAKPGMIRVAAGGGAIEVEVWELTTAAFGSFVAEVPPPLSIGTVMLADGSAVKGFLCEPAALAGAEEITHLGGWRAYLAQQR